uniref:LRRCT domain-containing protein n=1 Tax=Tetranychus urticae TaxID=32264 RepID=T1K0A0_TETUR
MKLSIYLHFLIAVVSLGRVNCSWSLRQLLDQQHWINLSSWFDPINTYTTYLNPIPIPIFAIYPPLPYHLPFPSALPQPDPSAQSPLSTSTPDETTRFFASQTSNLDLPIGNIVKALDYPSLGRLSLLNVSIDLSQPLTSKPIQHLRLVKVAWPSSLEPFSVNSLRYSLRRLEIISSGLTSFPFSFISSNYYLLKDIDLRYNSFQSIPDFAFSFNSALETIDLSHNDISYLGSYAFAQLPNLRQLILSHNKLKVVNNYALAANHNVNRNNLLIDLTYNKMFHLATGTFDNQTPTYLDLRHNSLVSLDQTVFLDLIKRMSMQPEGQINVTDNSFQCTCKRTRWLVELRKEEKTVIQGFTCKFTAGNDKDLLSLTLNDINC